MLTLTPGSAAVAGSASWAHQTGSVASNGSVTIKSLSGGSYAGTQNPTGAVAKANQTAATQPPTVIIQATSGQVFNFKDDCYILVTFASGTGSNYTSVALGKIVGLTFSGVMAGDDQTAAGYVLGSSLGGGAVAIRTKYIGSDANSTQYLSNGSVLIADSVPIVSSKKCYP